MSADSAQSNSRSVVTSDTTSVLRESIASLVGAAATLPICLASALLAFAPLGPAYLELAGKAGLYGFVFGGVCAALFATSSFVISSPRASIALVQASLAAILLTDPAFSRNPAAILASMALCVLLAGFWQIMFGAARIATVIKYTPHPVLAGFINGVALLIVISQLKPQFAIDAGLARAFALRPAMLALVVGVAAIVIGCGIIFRNIPGIFVGFAAGVLGYYLAKLPFPGLDLGATLGMVGLTIPPALPLAELWNQSTRESVLSHSFDLFWISLALAVVATLESLLALRLLQQSSGIAVQPVRDLVAQGIGNFMASVAGGLAIAASPAASRMAFRAGGRTRFVGIAASVITLWAGFAFPSLLGTIPTAVLSGVLLAVGILLFDKWSIQLARSVFRKGRSAESRRPTHDLSIVAAVMAVTAFYSIVAGVVAGVSLACAIFIVNMSRPIVLRRHTAESVSSKRIRPMHDVAILRASGSRRSILELQGVLFFGNADDLSHEVLELFEKSDAVLLDLKGISDIDISGANVLREVVQKAQKQKKRILFCNSPASVSDVVAAIVKDLGASDHLLFPDRDSALEFMEEETLRAQDSDRRSVSAIALEHHDFLAGIDEVDRRVVAKYLVERKFSPSEVLCQEGDNADRMWLLVRGSVSVRLRMSGREGRRIASLATGTIVGELALIEFGKRSATVIADDEVLCYELHAEAFELLLKEHATIANKLLVNLARELARRVRKTSDELREAMR